MTKKMKKHIKKSPLSAAAARPVRRTLAKPKAPVTGRGVTPATAEAEAARALQSTLTSGPTLGTIKLEVSTMGADSVLLTLSNLQEGLAKSGFYRDFPVAISTAIGTNKEALAAAMADYDAGEIWLRALRSALDLETNNGRNTLRTAASACESLDRRDESLLGVGWELRRPPGRPRPVAAPNRFTVKNTGYEGEVEARWTRVSTATSRRPRSSPVPPPTTPT